MEEGYLIGGADTELLNLEAAVLVHVGVETAHVVYVVGALVVEQGYGVGVIGPAAVEGGVEIEGLGCLCEAAEGELLAVAVHEAGMEGGAAAVVVVVVGEHHVVDIAAMGIDALDVAGYPLAGMALGRGQDGYGQTTAPDGVVVAAVEQQGGAVGQDVEGGLGYACIDEMYLHLAGFPSGPRKAHEWVFGASCIGCLPVGQAGRACKGGCAKK